MSALASQSVPAFEIAGRKIGPQYPPYVIAEISCNFAYANDSKWGKAGKDYQRCVELIKQAAAAGCDAVKLQTYRADTITMKSTKPHFMIKGAKVDLWNDETQNVCKDFFCTPTTEWKQRSLPSFWSYRLQCAAKWRCRAFIKGNW